MPESKLCTGCKEVKLLNEFYLSKRGWSFYCKACQIKSVLEEDKTDVGRAKRRVEQRRLRFDRKTKLVNLLGGKCVKCGLSDIRVLQVNHKNGGGLKETRKGGHVYQFYKAIIEGRRSLSDLELRCANCNILYEYERGKRFLGS